MQVTLSNGTVQDIDKLSPVSCSSCNGSKSAPLRAAFASRPAARKSGPARFREGYDTVTQLVAARMADGDERLRAW